MRCLKQTQVDAQLFPKSEKMGRTQQEATEPNPKRQGDPA
jgi:hypothetical protein